MRGADFEPAAPDFSTWARRRTPTTAPWPRGSRRGRCARSAASRPGTRSVRTRRSRPRRRRGGRAWARTDRTRRCRQPARPRSCRATRPGTHSKALPCMSNSPQALGGLAPTAWGALLGSCRRTQPTPAEIGGRCRRPRNATRSPARQAYSHSASLGSRASSQRQNMYASHQLTLTTGWSSRSVMPGHSLAPRDAGRTARTARWSPASRPTGTPRC